MIGNDQVKQISIEGISDTPSICRKRKCGLSMQDRQVIHGSLKTLIIAPTASLESFLHILYSDTLLSLVNITLLFMF